METYLFTWNPQYWDWENLEQAALFCSTHGYYIDSWSSGSTKRIILGDRFFLTVLGKTKSPGIIASGVVTSTCYQDKHYADSSRVANYNKLKFEVLLNPQKHASLSSHTLHKIIPGVKWSPRGSGISLSPGEATRLEDLWIQHLKKVGLSPHEGCEIIQPSESYPEGALKRVTVNSYERSPQARQECIDHYGYRCFICDFDFAAVYGETGEGFVHVHHLIPLAEIGEKYKVDPINDLIPVCPNCHAMLHRRKSTLSPEGLRARIKKLNNEK